jgi:hypothetical protein
MKISTYLTCASRSKKGISLGGTSPTAPRPWSRAAWPPDDAGALMVVVGAREGASARAEAATIRRHATAVAPGIWRLDVEGAVGSGAFVEATAVLWCPASDAGAGAEIARRSMVVARERESRSEREEREKTEK